MLVKKNKISYFKGLGSFKSPNQISIKDKDKITVIETEKTVICTGSEPVSLSGVKIDEKKILSSTGALSIPSVPKKMVVVGAGYIGLEMGSVWARLGSEVHVVEFLDHILPGMDKEISSEFMKILNKQGIKFHLKTKVDSINKTNSGVVINTTNDKGKSFYTSCDTK